MTSGLYLGTVVHRRVRPVRHRLTYRVFTLLVDLDELPELDRSLRLFAHNRAGIVSFHDRDHGPRDGRPLKPWIEEQMRAAGLPTGGPVRLLCFPRLWGYVFNPLTVWFCHGPDGALSAILYEVSNTFGEHHSYLIPAVASADGTIRQACDKRFFVSPFMDMETRYHFRVRPPAETLGLAIHQTDAQGDLLHAGLSGSRRPLDDRSLAAALLKHPLMTLKVFAGIHWEALHLWRKGLRLRPRPPLPPETITIATATGAAP